MKVVTPEQMREIDRITIEDLGLPGLDLMECAGGAVAEMISNRLSPESVSVCTGKGNNAGDGFVIARLLAEQEVEVTIFMATPADDLHGDCLSNFQRLPEWVNCIVDPDGSQFREQSDAEVIVDAVLGTGLTGEPRDSAAAMIKAINEIEEGVVVAVDTPSGVGGGGVAVLADLTITFGWPKVPMVIHPGVQQVGELVVADIGFPPELAEEVNVTLATGPMAATLLPERPADSHKGTFGHLLLIAGSQGMSGAVTLAAKAALRSGVGLVTVMTPECCMGPLESHALSAIKIPMIGTALNATPLMNFDFSPYSAVAVGPGIGTTLSAKGTVGLLMEKITVPLIMDADALNCVVGTDWLSERTAPTIITPHPREMARLLGKSVEEIQADRIASACEIEGVVSVLKGARTITASPDGHVWINTSGNTGLAKGGSGDVLTGLIGGLASHMAPEDAAVLGVHWHGLAADMLAESIGERAMTPEDVIDALAPASEDLARLLQPEEPLPEIE